MELLVRSNNHLRRSLSLVKENGSIFVICLATAISMIGQGIITPVLPLFAKELGVRTAAVGLVVGTFGISRIFMNLPSGFIAERYGRRLLMGVGLLFGAAGLFLTGASHSLLEMAAWRFVSGSGSAMFTTGALSFIAAVSTPQNRGRLMSLQLGSLLVGTDIGPMIGGLVADNMGFRWPFYIAAMISTGTALGVFAALRDVSADLESSAPGLFGSWESRKEGRDMGAIRSLLSNPTFLIVNFFTLLVFFTRAGSRQTIMPLLATEKAGMSATQLGFLFFLMTTINLILVMPAGAVTDRFGRKAVIFPGAFLTLLGLSLFAWTSTPLAYFGAAFLLGLGSGLIGSSPAAYAGDMAPPGKTGTTLGLYRTFGDVGFIIGPIFLGWAADVFNQRFGDLLGMSFALELNALMLLCTAALLSALGKETAGRCRQVL